MLLVPPTFFAATLLLCSGDASPVLNPRQSSDPSSWADYTTQTISALVAAEIIQAGDAFTLCNDGTVPNSDSYPGLDLELALGLM